MKQAGHSPVKGRYIIQPEEQPLPTLAVHSRLEGLFLITEDSLGVARALTELMIYRGAFAYVLDEKTCRNETALQEEVERACGLFGQVNGIIHLAGLRAMPMPTRINTWREEVQLQCKSFFQLLQFAQEDLQTTVAPFKKLIACSLLGGHYGRDLSAQPGLPLAGSGQGLLRSLEQEWDSILAKTIDFDNSLQPARMAELILRELFAAGPLEIGYPQGRRTVFSTVQSSIQPGIKPKGLVPKKSWVVLATGGARGITAETVQLLSNEDGHFVLVGRSPLLPLAEHQKYYSFDEAGLRREFIAEAAVATTPITPRLIEQRIARILNDREIRANIGRMRRTGTKVSYRACDVADAKAFGELIDSVYDTLGRIDVVVHGAGVIDDYLLADKTTSSFDKVFNTKVDSAFILYNKLRWESLSGFVFFSSTAGRYGNRGQSDYAAANEVLNRLAWRIRAEWPNVLVKSLNWGPWAGVGMASGAVNEQFLSRGIVPIDALEGTRHFMGELLHGDSEEVEVVLGEGTWDPGRENRLRELFDLDISSLRFFN